MLVDLIKRPILSSVISIMITLLGLLALTQLPITQYPDIAPPEVNVTTKYTGANSETCVKAVVTTLERAINGVPGMEYITSVSGNDGTSVIQIIFKNGTNPDLAAVNVQNRVSSVVDELPEEVTKAGVIVEKVQNSMLLYINVLSDDPSLDEKFLFNYTDINIINELKRIDGVGFADILGSREYAMRIWLKPDKLKMYGVSTDDIISSLKNQNIEAAPGKLGESSGKKAQDLQYVLKYTGKFNTKKDYENIVIKSTKDGELLKIKDIADVEFDSQEYDVTCKENGKPSAAILLKQRPGSNAKQVISNIKLKMEELQKKFPPGVRYTLSYDVSLFLEAAIDEVIKTLVEAFILVSLVVFIFLQDWRSTLIPALTVPVSLIGTFFFLQVFGFSLNLITLFALVLAIGIVVDNAIVVVEAVHEKMQSQKIPPLKATEQTVKEISGAIIAITLVMSAVFIPVSFIPGSAGIFFKQFSVTMVVAIVLSGVTALTLTPALCVILLKEHTHDYAHPKSNSWLSKFFEKFNLWYDNLSIRYQILLRSIVRNFKLTIGTLVAFSILIYILSNFIPSGFIPEEDQGTIYANITTPSGATLERTEQVADEVQKIASKIDAVNSVSSMAGYSILSEGVGAIYGMNLISLKHWNQRNETDKKVIEKLEQQTSYIKDAQIEFFRPPPVPGFGNSSGFELRLLDQTGSNDFAKFKQITDDFIKKLNQRPEISNAFTTYEPNFPQYLVQLDYDKAAKSGVSANDAMGTLQTLIGSEYATNFIRFGQLYRVMVQAAPEYRTKPEDILKLSIKNNEGAMVPFSSFVTLKKVFGPEQITRYNMYLSAMVNGQPAKGYSSGDAINAIKETAQKHLPKGYSYDWAGATRDEANAGNKAIFIYLISLLFVYLLLSAQYESFKLPFPVLLSLPFGVFGAFLFLWVFGLQNNIYAQVSLIMLFGILGKNAILIIEYAVLKQSQGLTPYHAVIDAAVARLRPILMTSFAFVAGLIPLMIASGAGAIGNRTIGSASAGGMTIGTIIGVIFIPSLYLIFAKKTSKSKKDY